MRFLKMAAFLFLGLACASGRSYCLPAENAAADSPGAPADDPAFFLLHNQVGGELDESLDALLEKAENGDQAALRTIVLFSAITDTEQAELAGVYLVKAEVSLGKIAILAAIYELSGEHRKNALITRESFPSGYETFHLANPYDNMYRNKVVKSLRSCNIGYQHPAYAFLLRHGYPELPGDFKNHTHTEWSAYVDACLQIMREKNVPISELNEAYARFVNYYSPSYFCIIRRGDGRECEGCVQVDD